MQAEDEQDDLQPCIVQLQHYFTDNESNLSFPVWFNDSLIRQHGIQSISRSIYMSSDALSEDSLPPKEVINYEFDTNGQLITFHVNHYYENVNVGSASFHYIGEQDQYGYCDVTKGKIINEYDDISQGYTIYNKEKYTEKYLVYRDEDSGDFCFYMLEEMNWGALSVDSILNPKSEDLIVLGTPSLPVKKYKVKNRVNESDVVGFNYYGSSPFVKTIDYDKYPFHYRRTICYSSEGICTGFVDSTYSNNEFLTRRVSSFLVKNGILETVEHKNSSGNSENGSYQYEQFTYTYFESE